MSRPSTWTNRDLCILRWMCEQRMNSFQIAERLNRSPSSIRTKCSRMKLKLAQPHWAPVHRDPNPANWTDADRISEYANVPQHLAELVTGTASESRIPLRRLRSDSRLKELVECRRNIIRKALEHNYSFPQIGRALNRDHTTIMHHARAGA